MNFSKMSDSELVILFRNGNTESFNQLIKRHQLKIKNSIISLIKDKNKAEDIFQETIIKIIDLIKNQKYEEQGMFLYWVLRIANNICIDYLKSEKKKKELYFENCVDSIYNKLISDEDTYFRENVEIILSELIEQLPNSQKEILKLKIYSQLTFEKIAKIKNISINTALGRMRYATSNLKKKLKERNYHSYYCIAS